MEYLVHHGIKGMHWGIRRYQNYDGRYTQAGLARYRESINERDKAKAKYKAMKNNGGYTKHELKKQKAKIKLADKQADRRYDLLKKDKLADKGRIRYEEGERILERNAHTKTIKKLAWSSTFVGTLMIKEPQKVNTGLQLVSKVLTGGRKSIGFANLEDIQKVGAGLSTAGMIGNAVVIGKQAVDNRKNKQISSYYSHRYAR